MNPEETTPDTNDLPDTPAPSKPRLLASKAVRYSGIALVGLLAAGAVILNRSPRNDSEDEEGDES